MSTVMKPPLPNQIENKLHEAVGKLNKRCMEVSHKSFLDLNSLKVRNENMIKIGVNRKKIIDLKNNKWQSVKEHGISIRS